MTAGMTCMVSVSQKVLKCDEERWQIGGFFGDVMLC